MDARTKVDCFTTDALEQIKDVVKGNEPTYVNRGGVGKDVRYLSDFALLQIKNAVGEGGSQVGGGFVTEIKSVYKNAVQQSITKVEYNGEEYDGYGLQIGGDTNEYQFLFGEQLNLTTPNDAVLAIQANSYGIHIVMSQKIFLVHEDDLTHNYIYFPIYNSDREIIFVVLFYIGR